MKGLNKPNVFIRFILISTFLYAFLYLVYQFIVKKYTYYDQNFIGLIINSADFLLNLFGFIIYDPVNIINYSNLNINSFLLKNGNVQGGL